MSNLRVLRVRRSKLKSLSVVFAFVIYGSAGGQSPLPAQSSGAIPGKQFAEIRQSLTERADALIVGADQHVIVGVGGPKDPEISNRDLIVAPKQEPKPPRNGVLGSAVARVELLRPAIDPILQREGIPVELAAVVLVESGGNATALSQTGARGLWQLMPDTARRYGLVVDGVRDDRVDIEKSTHAAARYLSDLHLQFGSWPLALAAYNTGEQNLQRAIDRSHSTEFTVLNSIGRLPLETRNYVPAVLAAMRSFGQPFVLTAPHPTPAAITVFAFSNR